MRGAKFEERCQAFGQATLDVAFCSASRDRIALYRRGRLCAWNLELVEHGARRLPVPAGHRSVGSVGDRLGAGCRAVLHALGPIG